MNTQELVRDAKQNGGGTYLLNDPANYTNDYKHDWVRVDHTEGFMVAREFGIENLPDLDANIVNMVAFRWIEPNGTLLGLWQDERGNWSVDQSLCITDLRAAEMYGRLNDQRAIWDNANKTAISL